MDNGTTLLEAVDKVIEKVSDGADVACNYHRSKKAVIDVLIKAERELRSMGAVPEARDILRIINELMRR